MAMEMGRKKHGSVRGGKGEVFRDVRQEADSQEEKQSPWDVAEMCVRQFHVQATSGPSPAPVSQRRPGKLLGLVGCSLTCNCINSFSVSATHRKEHLELSNESAELVHKKSSESLPGTLKSQKDRDNHSPHSIP